MTDAVIRLWWGAATSLFDWLAVPEAMVVTNEEVNLSPVLRRYITVQFASLPHRVVVDATRNVTTFAKLKDHLGGASVLTPSLLERVFVF